MLRFTDWALEVLHRAHSAAARLDPDVRLRLLDSPTGLQTGLADQPEPGERALDLDGIPLVVGEQMTGLVDVEAPHDRLVLRPPGSVPNPRL